MSNLTRAKALVVTAAALPMGVLAAAMELSEPAWNWNGVAFAFIRAFVVIAAGMSIVAALSGRILAPWTRSVALRWAVYGLLTGAVTGWSVGSVASGRWVTSPLYVGVMALATAMLYSWIGPNKREPRSAQKVAE